MLEFGGFFPSLTRDNCNKVDVEYEILTSPSTLIRIYILIFIRVGAHNLHNLVANCRPINHYELLKQYKTILSTVEFKQNNLEIGQPL